MSLQEVENAIRVMNQAAFQELGDLFMISRDSDYNAFVFCLWQTEVYS